MNLDAFFAGNNKKKPKPKQPEVKHPGQPEKYTREFSQVETESFLAVIKADPI